MTPDTDLLFCSVELDPTEFPLFIFLNFQEVSGLFTVCGRVQGWSYQFDGDVHRKWISWIQLYTDNQSAEAWDFQLPNTSCSKFFLPSEAYLDSLTLDDQ